MIIYEKIPERIDEVIGFKGMSGEFTTSSTRPNSGVFIDIRIIFDAHELSPLGWSPQEKAV
jgi:hypothetical protein